MCRSVRIRGEEGFLVRVGIWEFDISGDPELGEGVVLFELRACARRGGKRFDPSGRDEINNEVTS